MMADETMNTTATPEAPAADTGLDFDINETTTPEIDTDVTNQDQPAVESESQSKPQQSQDDPDAKDFAGHVSNRIRNLVRKSPELGKVLTASPEIRAAIEAPMRRDLAFREIFPTVAEARAIRDRFPNGLQDVQALEADVKEIETVDNLTYTAGPEGNYPGHAELIGNVHKADPKAFTALARSFPREWHRLDAI